MTEPVRCELALELPADEKPGEDEEEVDPGPAVPEEGEPPHRGRGQLGASHREVIPDHQHDGRGAQSVERWEGAGWRNDE